MFLLFIASGSGFCAQDAPSIPKEFNDLYSELNDELSRIEEVFELDAKREAGSYPTAFCALLHNVDEEYKNAADNLEKWKALGLEGVVLQIGFPALYRPFYKTKEDYRSELEFYKKLTADIKAKGLKIIIEAQPFNARLGGEPDKEGAQQFCRKLKFKDYLKARATTAGTIAKELKPDYLCVLNEPDTEELFSAQPLNFPGASAQLVNSAIKEIRKAKAKGVKVSAGVGLWHPRYRSFLISFARSGRLDCLDLHIYPVNLGLLERMDDAADIAAKYNKKIGCSESWLYKCRTRESGKGINSDEIVARDAFSFWRQLDERFLEDVVKLARIDQFDYFSFSWPKYFYAYEDNKDAGLADSLMRLIKEKEAVSK